MKRITIIILTALIFTIFLFTSCQKAKEPEGKKEVQGSQAQKEEKPQSSKIKLGSQSQQEQKPIETQKGPHETPKPFAPGEKVIEGAYGVEFTVIGEIEKIRELLKKGKAEDESEAAYAMQLCDFPFKNLSIARDPAAIEITEEVMRTSQYIEVRACAAKAMGWYGNKKAVPILLEALKDKGRSVKVDVRLEAAGALLQLNEEIDAALETIDKLAQAKNASAIEIEKLFKWEKGIKGYEDKYVKTWRTLWNPQCEELMRRALTYQSDEAKAFAAAYFAKK